MAGQWCCIIRWEIGGILFWNVGNKTSVFIHVARRYFCFRAICWQQCYFGVRWGNFIAGRKLLTLTWWFFYYFFFLVYLFCNGCFLKAIWDFECQWGFQKCQYITWLCNFMIIWSRKLSLYHVSHDMVFDFHWWYILTFLISLHLHIATLAAI